METVFFLSFSLFRDEPMLGRIERQVWMIYVWFIEPKWIRKWYLLQSWMMARQGKWYARVLFSLNHSICFHKIRIKWLMCGSPTHCIAARNTVRFIVTIFHEINTHTSGIPPWISNRFMYMCSLLPLSLSHSFVRNDSHSMGIKFMGFSSFSHLYLFTKYYISWITI